MIFKCDGTKEEMVAVLKKPDFDDNIKYDFYEEKEGYCLEVKKIPFQLGKRRPVRYGMVFVKGMEGLYVQVEEMQKNNVLKKSSYEPELYRFFIEKCGCEPVEKIV